MRTNKYQLRIGASLELTDTELEAIRRGKCTTERFLEILQSERCSLKGDVLLMHPTTGEELLLQVLPETTVCRFFVDTPDGTMVAYKCGDDAYPGVAVDIKRATGSGGDVSLSLTEYIPGGESLSDYTPNKPAEMQRQKDEVPFCRRGMDDNGFACVTSGFVTRAWPNENANMDDHRRVFHHGYVKPANAKSVG